MNAQNFESEKNLRKKMESMQKSYEERLETLQVIPENVAIP